MSQRTCNVPECERPHRARGLCSSHYNSQHQARKTVEVACPTCGTVTVKQDNGKSTRRFCSWICRDVATIEAGANTGPRPRIKSMCPLPSSHPVRELMRDKRSPLRRAFEAEDWMQLLRLVEAECVKVEGCWLWGQRVHKGYGRVVIAGRDWMAHRLVALAVRNGELDARMPVHHVCAERLCCNPLHLQVVTPHENTAEMLERRYYLDRIAALESALRATDPSHPLLTRRIAPAA